jgi:ABC-type sugar transport system substrate-binding protein
MLMQGPRIFAIGAVVLMLSSLATGCSQPSAGQDGSGGGSGGGRIKVAMVPKLIGLAVFKANEKGARAVANELNIEFTYTGPVDASAQGQVETFNSLIAQNFDVITTSANNATVLAPALERAQAQGVKVVSYDSDVLPSARDAFVQNTPYSTFGQALVDCVAKQTGPNAQIAVLSSFPDATIQQEWLKAVQEYITQKYPGLKIVDTQYGESSPSKSLTAGLNILRAHPDVKGIIAPDGAAVVGAGNAVKQLGLGDKVAVSGTGTPNDTRELINSGAVDCSVLWDEVKEGEFIMRVARMVQDGQFPQSGNVEVKGFGQKEVKDGVIVFSDPLVFTKENVANYNF